MVPENAPFQFVEPISGPKWGSVVPNNFSKSLQGGETNLKCEMGLLVYFWDPGHLYVKIVFLIEKPVFCFSTQNHAESYGT